MTEAQALLLVSDYLRSHGYEPNRVDTSAFPEGRKSPDLEVRENGGMSFFCEVKTPLLLANDETKMFHWSTSVSKIRGFIHKAVSQFRDHDPNHHKPWVVVFTSDHMQLNWTNMKHVLDGYVSYDDGKIVRDLRGERYVIDTNNDVNTIDLYIWCQVNSVSRDLIYQIRFFLRPTILMSEARKIAERLVPRSEEKMH